jgi:hypothetical protein
MLRPPPQILGREKTSDTSVVEVFMLQIKNAFPCKGIPCLSTPFGVLGVIIG